MPKLILRDRQLGVVFKKLVTDTGGAPCCCGGVCCPADAPCLQTPILACNAGGLMVPVSCAQNRGYRMRLSTTWRSLKRETYTDVQGMPVVSVAQFGITASAQYCVSSDSAGDENAIARLIPDTMRLEGATFQSATVSGQSVFEFVASGSVLIPTGPARTDQLPVVNQEGPTPPAVVELLRPGTLGLLYPILGQGGGATGTATAPYIPISPAPCTLATVWPVDPLNRGRRAQEQYTFADACDAGRFTWSGTVDQRGRPVTADPTYTLSYAADLETTWTREYCRCGGGGGPTDLTITGGCANCGDPSTLEVIE